MPVVEEGASVHAVFNRKFHALINASRMLKLRTAERQMLPYSFSFAIAGGQDIAVQDLTRLDAS
jgi:predicted transcriptional regulator